MKAAQAASIGIAILALLTGLYVYPLLPEKVAVHWNLTGQADGYGSREMGAFFLPVLSVFMLGLFYVLPKIDPLKANYAAFRKEYDGLVVLMLAFFYYLFLLTLAFNFGYPINMTQALAPAFAAAFFYLGIMLGKAKQNWFVGIRTPWTLASERVWNKTHKIASGVFKAAGAVALLGIVLPEMFLAAIVGAVGGSLALVVYSYVEFQKEKKGKKN